MLNHKFKKKKKKKMNKSETLSDDESKKCWLNDKTDHAQAAS